MVFGEGNAPSPLGSEPSGLLISEPKVVFPARIALATLPIGAARSNLLSYGNVSGIAGGCCPRLILCEKQGSMLLLISDVEMGWPTRLALV